MEYITFNQKIATLNSWYIIHLPIEISQQLPSHGMVMVEGFLNDASVQLALEPDGKGSHWFKLDSDFLNFLDLKSNEQIKISIKPLEQWIEPEVPEDIKNALINKNLLNDWNLITTKAHWEWIRWIRFTSNPATRQKRITIMISKISSGKKRPCCFDHSRCTEPFVSKSGILLNTDL